jgi:hypothetical protein
MMAPDMGRRRPAIAAALVVTAVGAAACGSQGISSEIDSQPGAQGTTLNVRERERVDGPNFNTRHETPDNVLYALRNGGFSGAIMPENIVVGKDADDVAAFLSKYAGSSK